MEQIPLFNPEKPKRKYQPKEWKVVALRECPMPEHMQICENPQQIADYWKLHIATAPHFNPECECLVVAFLNARHRVRGHQLVSMGTHDSIMVNPFDVFRTAVVMPARAIVLMHNHPSGDPQPSAADVKVTRDLIKAGQTLRIEVLDHVVIGNQRFSSMRELGYFA